MTSEFPDSPPKMTQAEMLIKLSPAPFNQSKAVPPDAEVQHSPGERWWRSDSPDREGCPDGVTKNQSLNESMTRGVLGHGQRTGPGNFQTSSSLGSGTAAHFVEEEAPPTISGYGGHVAGKNAGNCIGGTYSKANEEAIEHLSKTSQVTRYGPGATQQN
mmetsp:Transcript_51499/g.105803  ORF Transcript_51499/g.105803 Transcript_51499/m.105803 type:complete len:159 (+) Transcript_51499:81-557(+)